MPTVPTQLGFEILPHTPEHAMYKMTLGCLHCQKDVYVAAPCTDATDKHEIADTVIRFKHAFKQHWRNCGLHLLPFHLMEDRR